MNFPVWILDWIGGGTLIALISVPHVYISHLAVGGGLFLWLTDWKGFRENNSKIHDYVRKHTWFFLLLTMVFGGMSGVGIWYIIALVQPAATSKLIHSFVFGWAIEWVFFLGEIVSLLIYHYYFPYLERKARLRIAFLYFAFAWLSMVIINGIVSFMLTPGAWLQTGYFWDGFFNPTYFSSLAFRTFAAIMFAGLFGFVTASYLKDAEFRTRMMRYCSKWLLYPIVGLVLSGIWYYASIPGNIQQVNFVNNADMAPFVNLLLVSTGIIFVLGVLLALRAKPSFQRGVTFVLVGVGLAWMGGFEYTREIARKPYVITDYMYTTSYMKEDAARLNATGSLPDAKWVQVHKVTETNRLQAGKEIYQLQCLSCHTTGGVRRDILPPTEDYPYLGMLSKIEGVGKINGYMPPFVGSLEEKEALAAYIAGDLHDWQHLDLPKPVEVTKVDVSVPKFDKKKDEYVLLAWNDLGMHCVSDCDKWFSILPPANTLEAVLIKRGETPEIVTEGVELVYQVQDGFENPSRHVTFWDYVDKNYGVTLEPNVGLSGNGLSGNMEYNEETKSFVAEMIPVVPYNDNGTYYPFPSFTITAYDTKTKKMFASIEVDPNAAMKEFKSPKGELIARTNVVAPTAAMGCANCHAGEWRFDGKVGISDKAAMHILKTHDRLSGTNLYEEAVQGNPRLCQSCHPDPVLKAKGDSKLLSLSTAIHGWHANYMPYQDERACGFCHPSSPSSATVCSRGIHSQVGLTCVNCHGTMADHTLSLLKKEKDKKGAERLMKHLKPVMVAQVDDIKPRTSWMNEPECLTCHVDFQQPAAGATAFNVWTEGSPEELYRLRTDEAGLRCEACHNSPHAVYPTKNIYGDNVDNVQPLQYGGMPYPIGSNLSCEVCHTVEMEDDFHHENTVRMFRSLAQRN